MLPKPPLAGGNATSLAVSPTGTTYTMTGQLPRLHRRPAWQLPPNLEPDRSVPGFATAAGNENWVLSLEGRRRTVYGGPQLAISADGSTLYWKDFRTNSSPTEAGELIVHGYSLSKGETTAIWGGGTSKCKMQTTSAAPLAASPAATSSSSTSAPKTPKPPTNRSTGRRSTTFGHGGTGCVEPVAKFTVNGKKESEEATVNPGETVTFSAACSELAGGFRNELIWKFGDGSEKVVTQPKARRRSPGDGHPRLLERRQSHRQAPDQAPDPAYGNPAAVERTFNVGSPVSGFKLKVSKTGSGSGTVTSSPAGINCHGVCQESSERAKRSGSTAFPGSAPKRWSGVAATASSAPTNAKSRSAPTVR